MQAAELPDVLVAHTTAALQLLPWQKLCNRCPEDKCQMPGVSAVPC